MPHIPHDESPESTIALLKDPYRFISKRCQQYETELFEARIMLRKTICMMGQGPAELFYDQSRFKRHGAPPDRIQKTLFGKGGVQGLDDEAHRHRKAMFMALVTPERVADLAERVDRWWRRYTHKWASMDQLVLYDQLHEVLTMAVCDWAGVPIEASEAAQRAHQLTAMFDAAGAIGPRHWWARLERKRASRWIEQVISQIRASHLEPPEESAAYVIAWHQDLKGNLLSPHDAAVEVLNVLRSTVAVSAYIIHAAHALHQHAIDRERLVHGENDYAEWFVQEVRRYYPFFPAVVARVRQDFAWNGYQFPKGIRVMLDLYGTNHDSRIWEDPEAFRPDRFRDWNGHLFSFIPQGGGVANVNHRCPGEGIAIELMKVALRFLAGEMKHEVPEQDLRIDYSRLPALPTSHFVIRHVQQVD